MAFAKCLEMIAVHSSWTCGEEPLRKNSESRGNRSTAEDTGDSRLGVEGRSSVFGSHPWTTVVATSFYALGVW